MTKLYQRELDWLHDIPELEVCAAYKHNILVFEKTGEDRRIRIERHELRLIEQTVFTHWHPPLLSRRLYGHEDAPLSWNDIVAALAYEQSEIRALTTVSLHRFIFPKYSARGLLAARFAIDLLDPGRQFADAHEQERWLHHTAKTLLAKYIKIPLDK